MKSLSLMTNRTFHMLEFLDLSGLPLGDEGVDLLLSMKA